ncbi:MAG: HlyD family type I secretion periplasmic adaptor subunit [Pseudomonadota bacterium]
MLEGLRKHVAVAWDAYRADKDEAKTRQDHADTAFLPPALEILETPPNPLGRTVLWVIMLFLMLAVLWSVLGKVDVVASAQGKVIPEGRVKIVQAAGEGVVREILVRDGEKVEQGAPLIVLDPTVTGADLAQAEEGHRTALIDLARAEALASHSAGKPMAFTAPDLDPAMSPTAEEAQAAFVRAKTAEHEAARAEILENIVRATRDQAMVAAEAQKLEEQIPLVDERLQGLQELASQGYAPRMRVAGTREQVIALTQDLAIRREELGKHDAALGALRQSLAKLEAEFAAETLDALTEAEAAVRLRREELVKAEERSRLTMLTAPEAGTIAQLSIHTIGAVVRPADALLTVVPAGSGLMVEAMVLNKDAGFVRQGQPVEVKLEAYPFTRYGVVTGRLETISRDAVENEDLGLVYPAIVHLDTDVLEVHGEDRLLEAGLSATAEIKTGRRRIIDFLLSPLSRRMAEAGRER